MFEINKILMLPCTPQNNPDGVNGKLPESARKLKVLCVAGESVPFSSTGGLGDVIGSLSCMLNKRDTGVEMRVILPLYETMPAEHRAALKFVKSAYVPVSWRKQYCGLFSYRYKNTVFYFIDNEYYFKRPTAYGYGDDGERFAFFCRAVLEMLPYLKFKPDVLHCHDWQTALVPVYYKLFYMNHERYSNIKTVFTIHNIEYQGKFSKNQLEDVFGIPFREYHSVSFDGCINLLKAAIDYSDKLTTVSETYAKELLSPEHANGLSRVLYRHRDKLTGILNGIDTNFYNPKSNRYVFTNYDAKTLIRKRENKTELQKMLSLTPLPDVPIVAIISRLVPHKGIDLIERAMGPIMQEDVQFIVLGTGDTQFENFFRHIESTSNGKARAVISFDAKLAQKIYAGSDILLMPSRSEPCGLAQMIACRYATVPVVRGVGGLRDSIIDCGDGKTGNGFVFDEYNSDAMLYALRRALYLYREQPIVFEGLRKRCATHDFSWRKSAKTYADFYKNTQ